MLKKVIHKAVIALFTLSLMVGCASIRNSKIGHFYNNVTARYNGYFNAKELVKAAKIKTEEGHIDDYTQILKVFRWGSEQSGKALASDMDKAIEKCSEVIQKHEGSDWVDDAYTTVAMAYFYKGDYYAALDLFKYLASEYERTETESLAQLWIVKCYIQIGKIEEAQAYLTNIQNDRKKFENYTTEIQLLNAELKIGANNITEAINSLNKAIPNVKNRKDAFRYKFILAQLYEQQGNKNRAGELYSSLLNRNMPYEFQFQTRIKAAKCVNLNAKGELQKIIRSFNRLLKDDNNREYFDQIYYEIGNIYLAAGQENEAIKNYKISAWIGEDNLTQKTNTYLALGDLFFKNNLFETAGAYYDSCASVVPEAHPQYESIVRQQSILGELIVNLQTIRVQDSLLNLANMPIADIRKVVRRAQAQDSLQVIKDKEREEIQERRKELREENEGSSIANSPNSLNNTGGWYFENPVSIGKGAIDFKRVWGPRPLEDNWRRSQKAIVFNTDPEGTDDTLALSEGRDSVPELVDPGMSEELTNQLQKISEDQKTYFANIPFLQAQKRASEGKVIEALFNNGLIYYEKLQDLPSAIQSFETLLSKYPGNKFESAAHYYLFKIYEGQENAEKTAYHREILLNTFPDSQYTKLLNGNGIDAEKKNPMLERYYALAYSYFKAGKCDSVTSVALTAEKSVDQNYLRSKFDFLNLVCKGRGIPRDSFIFNLQGFITTYPKGDAAEEAKNLMRYLALQEAAEAAANDTSSTTSDTPEKAPVLEKEYPFTKSQEGAFYFIMVVNDEKFNTQKVKSEIGNYNTQYHRSEALNVKSLVFDDGKQLFWVKTFEDINKAKKYHKGLVSDETFLPNARISSASMFYISTDNFKLLISDENTEDYIEFFELYFVDKEKLASMQETEGMDPNEEAQTPDDKLSAHEEFIAQLDSTNTPAPENKKKKRKIWLYLAISVWLMFAAGVISFVVVINQIKDGAYGELPTADDIENPRNPLSTNVYTTDGQIIGKYFTENRTNVSYDDLSPHLVNALIATEDERFTEHAGIDFRALFRVAIRTVLGGDRSGGGGSTLSQQLAKNLFDLREKEESRENNMAIKKFQEWVIAVQLESKYTKEEILTMYLNTVDYLYGAYGIHAAAHTYFGKDPKELDIVEAASLVGMLKGPALYNPKRNADTAKYRRKIVFIQMHRNGFISEAEKDSLKELDLSLHMSTQDHNKGMAPYFREHLRQYLHEWQERTGYNIYKDGLKVYTTLNYKVQAHAEKAMKDHMKYLQKHFFEHWDGRDVPWVKNVAIDKQVRFSQRYNWLIRKTKKKHDRRPTKEDIEAEFSTKIQMKVFSYRGEIDTFISPLDSVAYYKHFLQSGMMAVEPSTGYILSWVGGIDHKHFKYDHVNVKAKRQVGSTFKPFVYAAGIETGYLPCATAPNIPVVFDNIITGYNTDNEPIYGTWDAKNSPPKYGGKMSLMQGMATSTNTITAWVLKEIGPQAAVDMARRLGVTSKLDPYPAICLGVYDVSVYEMVGAFNAFNNNGLWVEPLFVTRIEDQFGNTIESFVPKSREAIDPVTNYAIVKMMEKVVQRGTGVRLISSNYYNIRTPLAGKTGTTQNGADGWFIGYEPGITAGVWVGGEDRSVAFRDMKFGQGARLAMPVFGDFINAINADEDLNFGDVTEFPKPNATIPFGLDCEFYKYNEEDQNDLDAGEDQGVRF